MAYTLIQHISLSGNLILHDKHNSDNQNRSTIKTGHQYTNGKCKTIRRLLTFSTVFDCRTIIESTSTIYTLHSCIHCTNKRNQSATQGQ